MIKRQGRHIVVPLHYGSYTQGFVEDIRFPPEVSGVEVQQNPMTDELELRYLVEVPRYLRVSRNTNALGIQHILRQDVRKVIDGDLPIRFVKAEEEPQFLCIELSL